MFTLPIKAGWCDLILHGYKKEEYRKITLYNTIRLKKLFDCEGMSQKEFIDSVNADDSGRYRAEAILKSGGNYGGRMAKVKFTLKVKEGEVCWGAESGTLYYALVIEEASEVKP